MIEIKVVHGRRMRKKFVRFPNEIFKDDPHYVPPIELDEYNLMHPKKNASFEDSDAECFLAYRDGKVVGRIMGIISHLYNKKNNEKRARLSRFDCIDDQEVANALFETVENWAKEKGMDTIHGPLGFNDLEREGLMVSGHEYMGTFQCSYHAPYYKKLVENAGYKPEATWIEWRLYVPEKCPERVARVAEVVEKRYGIHEKRFKSMNEIIKKHGKDVFELIDLCYKDLYGTIPFTDKLIKQTIKLFKLVLDTDYLPLIFDKNDKFIGFGLGYASLAKAMAKSKGRYLPFGIFRMLHAIRHPKVLELGLIAVHPDYQKKGAVALIIRNMLERIQKNGIEYCDAGQELVTNEAVQTAFEMFDRELVRTKICYVKSLEGK